MNRQRKIATPFTPDGAKIQKILSNGNLGKQFKKEDWNVIYQLSLKSFVFECLMAGIIRVDNFP